MKKTVYIIVFSFFMICIINYSYAYSDVEEKYWAYDVINMLSEKNILSGYPDGTFKPKNNITRAEFIIILIKVVEPNADVSSITGYWAEGSINLLRDKNILRENDYSEFDPDKYITRREICLMLYRSIEGISNIDIDSLDNKKFFCDINQNNDEESRITAVLSHFGILNGYPDGTAKLDSFSSRAELCAFINNFMKSRCILLSVVNDNEVVLYENDIASVKLSKLPKKLKKWRYSKDVPYATTEIKEISIFPFDNPPDKYRDIFNQFNTEENKYLQYRKKFGEGNYVVAVLFDTTNNTYDSIIYAGYEFLHLSFPEEEIDIIDAFDLDEIVRQTNGNANIGEVVEAGKIRSTSAFYVINKLPESKIRFDRDITGIYNPEENKNQAVTSFHSLIVNLESR